MPRIAINSNNGDMKEMLNDVSKKETQLLLQINTPLLSSKALLQYDLLHQKLKAATISKEEHIKLLRLIKSREKKSVERLAALIELSQLKKIAPKVLMKKMGLSTLSYA